MKLLIVEDEVKTGEYLKQGLRESGFIVDLCNNGQDGYHLAMTEHYDLIILDVILPDMNGWSIVKSLRDNKKDVPVIFLTARDDINDKVKGFELGANDYLVKPFAFAELLARIRNLLQRNTTQGSTLTLTIADLEIDITSHSVKRGGHRIHLSPREFTLLELLARRQGEALPRALIASQVWDINFDSDTNNIDVAIRRLRAKIDDDFDHKLIQTVRGMGYMIDKQNGN